MTDGPGKKTRIALHILAGLLTFAFLGAGSMKLMGAEELVASFERWGFPLWIMTLTGAVEVTAAVLIAIPKTRIYGALLLFATMVGAMGIHIWMGEFAELPPSVILFLLTGLQVFANRHALPMVGGSPATLKNGVSS